MNRTPSAAPRAGLLLCLALAGCSTLTSNFAPTPTWPGLADVDTLGPAARQRELVRLQKLGNPGPAERLRLAALYEREGDADDLERGLRALNGLDDPATRPLAELLRRLLGARLEAKQQAQRADALDARLEQIKSLEKSLQQRSGATP